MSLFQCLHKQGKAQRLTFGLHVIRQYITGLLQHTVYGMDNPITHRIVSLDNP